MPPGSRSIARIRRRAESAFFTDRCQIQHLVPGTGPIKGENVWQTVANDVPCRLIQQEKPAQPESALLSGQEVIPDYYILELPYDQVIDVDFRVIVAGMTYNITRIEAGLTDRAFKQVVITRRRGAG